MRCRQIRTYSLSNCTFLTNYIGSWNISPFLISHPNRFRSADLGDSFPPGEAMVLPHQCVTYQFVSVLTKTDNLNWNLSGCLVNGARVDAVRGLAPRTCEGGATSSQTGGGGSTNSRQQSVKQKYLSVLQFLFFAPFCERYMGDGLPPSPVCALVTPPS